MSCFVGVEYEISCQFIPGYPPYIEYVLYT